MKRYITFKSSGIIFLFLIILCGIWHYYYGISIWWVLAPILLFKLIVIWGSSKINSNFHINALCEGETKSKEIAITFDDGPNKEFTPQVLKVLKEFNAPATFFVIGKNIDGNEDILKEIDAAGHIIGNHTFSHSFFIDLKSKRSFIAELNQTMQLVYKITGRQIRFFRPPYGVTTPNLASASNELNYSVIGWNIRSMDTTKDSVESIEKRVREQIKPGAVILFHDTSAKTVQVLKQTLNFAKENGFKIVSTEALLKVKAYEG